MIEHYQTKSNYLVLFEVVLHMVELHTLTCELCPLADWRNLDYLSRLSTNYTEAHNGTHH